MVFAWFLLFVESGLGKAFTTIYHYTQTIATIHKLSYHYNTNYPITKQSSKIGKSVAGWDILPLNERKFGKRNYLNMPSCFAG